MTEPLVSIIIPVKEINEYIKEAVKYIEKQTYQNYEILIFPDRETEIQFPKTKIIPTGEIGPADKRDLAIKHASGEIFAFLDDDAYPREDWLEMAIRNFQDETIAAVGGPALTPENSNIFQKASGAVFESFMGGGGYSYRYVPKKKIYVDDYPTVNLLVRKDIFIKAGGFDSHYWPGEDTKLCLDITNKLNKKIIYDPEVVVWHHRRELFLPHLKQISRYGLHRGKFAVEFPETSLRISYFIPSIFVLFILLTPIFGLIFPAFQDKILKLYFSTWLFYMFLLTIESFRVKSLALKLLLSLGIFTTHISYGIMFIIGLLKKELKR